MALWISVKINSLSRMILPRVNSLVPLCRCSLIFVHSDLDTRARLLVDYCTEDA